MKMEEIHIGKKYFFNSSQTELNRGVVIAKSEDRIIFRGEGATWATPPSAVICEVPPRKKLFGLF